MGERGEGNDDEANCASASGEHKSRLLRRAPHPTSPLRTPRNDTVWAFSTTSVWEIRGIKSIYARAASMCRRATRREPIQLFQILPQPVNQHRYQLRLRID